MAPPPPTPLKPFQLLEINIMSAQDLEPISKKMRTYATASIHQNRKLSTCVDAEGKNNPTWNDKFVFKVDEEFLRRDTSAIMIEIYAVHWFKDVLVGTVRVLVGNVLIPPPPSRARHHSMGTRFVALQVRRPSGRPQGILNIGVALLDSSIRSMPLYRQLSISAVGYRDLMADPPTCQRNQSDEKRDKDDHNNNNNNNSNNKNLQGSNAMNPILRRTRSERSERMAFDDDSLNSSSIAAVPAQFGAVNKESSILSITDGYDPFKGMKTVKGKASSVISGAELREKPKNNNSNKSKAGSVLSDSIFSKQSSGFHKMGIKDPDDNKKNKNFIEEKQPLPLQKNINTKYAITTPQKKSSGNNNHGSVVWSDSEVGPSPSEVAAAMAERRLYPLNHQDDQSSSVLDGWSLDESVEGLRSKLERWRMELPPLYDRGGGGDLSSSSHRSSGRHVRRHTDGGGISNDGMFSCFGNIFGYECQCVCGKPPRGRRSLSARFHSPSTNTPVRSFV